jgi:hypothetical protein
LTAAARDAAGNITVSNAVSVTVDISAPVPPTPSGTIAHWPFDETTGTIAPDVSGNNYTATLMNGPTWTVGRVNRSLAFDGINDVVTAPQSSTFNAFPLTIAAWIKTTSATGLVGIVNKYVAGSFNGYNLFMRNGALCAWYLRGRSNYVYDGSRCTLKTTGYNDNRWHHVAYVVEAAGARLYVDGVLRKSRAWTGPAGVSTTTQRLQIGRYPGASDNVEFFPGSVDDVRIYNRALTVSEIAALAQP